MRSIRFRWRSIRAVSDTITHGTWTIVAVALGTLVVGAVAIPASPVHQWLHQEIKSISCISATRAACSTVPSTSGVAALNDPTQGALVWILTVSHNPSVSWTLTVS